VKSAERISKPPLTRRVLRFAVSLRLLSRFRFASHFRSICSLGGVIVDIGVIIEIRIPIKVFVAAMRVGRRIRSVWIRGKKW
jgi:hypothetical protein